MKEASKHNGKSAKLREFISAVIVLAIVLVVPVFSLIEFGHFFRGQDSRSDAALPVMVQRSVDKTSLPPQLFSEPLITVTFDDGYESIYKTAMPLLQQYGIHTTQYVLGGTSDQPEYVSWKQIGEMQKGGHEIACHSMTHPDLVKIDASQLNYQLGQCKTELSKRFGTVTDFVSPYGSANDTTRTAISQYFDSDRNTNGDPKNGVTNADVNTADNFNRYNIIGVTVHHDTTVKELQELVAYAKATNGWLVLTYHQADDTSSSQFGVDPAAMNKQLQYLSKTNVRIVTMHDALESTRLQNVEF